MSGTTVLIHGWSDSSESFEHMKAFLARNGVGPVERILYADYESREDAVTFNDVADGLNDQFIEAGLIHPDGRKRTDVNVMVHSTGGLVIRHWIWRYYLRDGDRIDECPVRRVVMLAPANFGSPLAHRGKSFLGSLIKGRRGIRDFLEVGRRILTGLELASPYQWALAENDLLGDTPHFVPDRIQLTVLCGADEYEGLQGLVSRKGTDGTVVIAGTPLNAIKCVLEPNTGGGRAGGRPYSWVGTVTPNRTAFGVLPGLNHGSIVDAFAGDDADDHPLCRYVLRALTTEGPDDFEGLRNDLADRTRATFSDDSGRKAYQQFLVRAVDDQGVAIDDYTLEFEIRKAGRRRQDGFTSESQPSREEEELGHRATRRIAREFHQHSEAPSYRRFLVDLEDVRALLDEAEEVLGGEVVLGLRIHVPPIDRGIRYRAEELGSVALYPADAVQARGGGTTFFHPNTTTLLEIQVDRVNDYVTVGAEPRKH